MDSIGTSEWDVSVHEFDTAVSSVPSRFLCLVNSVSDSSKH